MGCKMLFLGAILALCVIVLEGGSIPEGKYAEQTNNIPEAADKPEFRSRNVIQVWEKAQRMGISEVKMAELKHLLKTHDQKAYQVKKEHREGRDVTEADTQLKIKLNQIMQRFGMARGSPDDLANAAGNNDVNREFEDNRLEQLWKHAQLQDHFNQRELDDLKQELLHHQDQLNEYNAVVEELYGPTVNKDADQKKRRTAENMTPTVEKKDVSERRARELELKLKHRDINKDYQRLRSKMTPEEERGGFTDRRLISLWQDALEAGFSEEELQSVKEELQAFESKINAYEETQKDAIREEKVFHNLKSRGENPPVEKYSSLREKAKDLGIKITETVGNWRKALDSGRIHKEL